MGKILSALRFILLIGTIISYLSILLLISLIFGYKLSRCLKMRRNCFRVIMKLLGVQVSVKGEPLQGNYLYIGNHRSYLDPPITLCDVMALPITKAEVSKWPLIGYTAKVTGVVFVKRENRDSRKQTLAAMLKILQNNQAVLIYPEGTTHAAAETIDFRMGAFRLAAEHGFPIIPMAIDYSDKKDYWLGNDTFIPHFLRSFAKWRTHVKIEYGKPIFGDNPEVLMEETKHWIDSRLLNKLEFTTN